MPPRGRGRGMQSNSIQSYFKVPDEPTVLGKRPAETSAEEVKQQVGRRSYEPQSSFSNFMNKKGDVIARLMEEKGVTEEVHQEHFTFKSAEWVHKSHGKK